ncbi:MAG: DUF2281 domain-containing protein [Candidatus Cloacimonetes bacterium]|nr:DUF2281 domain-containing protein [Candidatus Cloacimonadota bacterium]
MNRIHSLPSVYLKEILDFIDFMKAKYNKISDTELLMSIQGMSEGIAESRKENVEDCKTLEDIGWNNVY